MKRTMALWIILDLIFLVIFNVLFFVAGGVTHRTSVWISYGFIHFAYLMLLLSPAFIRSGKSVSVFGFSIYAISSAYFLLEFIIGVVFILISSDGYKIALLVQFIVAGLYGIMLISNMIANEHTSGVEENRQYQIDYVKKASAELKNILDNIAEKEARKSIERIYDVIYSSPVKSHPNMVQTESRILGSISELASAVSMENSEKTISLVNSLLVDINERNLQLKTLQ